MAHKVRRSAYETFNTRKKLPIRKKPYVVVRLGSGLILQYRRNNGNGAWIIKAAAGDGKSYWTKAFAFADDFTEAGTVLPDGTEVLTFFMAQDKAREMARKDDGTPANNGAPATVADALDRYEADLKVRGCSTTNATTIRGHLTPAILAKPVMLLNGDELTTWRNALVAKGLKASTVNRYAKSLRKALSDAARRDKRIKNASAWKDDMETLPDANNARNAILPSPKVRAFVAAAYNRGAHIGEYVEALASSGARPSQVARVLVSDLQTGKAPRLMMPRSGKGGSKDRAARKERRYAVPISNDFAKRLALRAKSKAGDALLFTQANGEPWHAAWTYRDDVAAIVEAISEKRATMYSLRHSSIAHMLLKGASAGYVALCHDTSTREIEAHYAKFITDHADDYARGLLPDLTSPAPAADNAVAMER
jgi:site-specific recombinase XerD